MAKGQQKSNREVRKPKKDAAAKSSAAANSVQNTFAQQTGKSGGKKK